GGILVEGHGMDGVLVGIGLNLLGPIREADGGAVPGATWLLGPEGILGREAASTTEVDELRELIGTYLARAVTRELEALESTEGDAQDAGTHRRYTMTCLTLGSAVRVDRLDPAEAGGTGSVHGTARAIDAHGRLVVDLEGGRSPTVDVGDVAEGRDEPVGQMPSEEGGPAESDAPPPRAAAPEPSAPSEPGSAEEPVDPAEPDDPDGLARTQLDEQEILDLNRRFAAVRRSVGALERALLQGPRKFSRRDLEQQQDIPQRMTAVY